MAIAFTRSALLLVGWILVRVGATEDVIELRGAGADFPTEVYNTWMAVYRAQRLRFLDVRMKYDARGSGFGIKAITGQLGDELGGSRVDFAATTSVLSDQVYKSQPDLQLFPSVAGALVIGYNLPGIKNLILTRDQLVGIYNGTLKSWSDATFSVYNPGVVFPNATIIPIARLDFAGTTEIFTNSLSSFSSEWNDTFGAFTDPARWDHSVVTVFGQRVTGMVDTILDRRFSVGYISPASANEVGLDYARIVNRHGNVVDATTASVVSAMNSRNLDERMTGTFVDSENPDAYPMAGYVYFVIHKSVLVNYCRSAVELVRYIQWFLSNRQAFIEAESRNMASVSSPIAAKIQSAVLDQIRCDGQRIVDLVHRQEYEEEESLKTWKTPVEVLTPIVAFVIIALIAYSALQKIKYRRALDRNDWNINFSDIDFSIPKKRRGNRRDAETKVVPGHLEGSHDQSTHNGKTATVFSLSGRLSGNSVTATEMRLEKIFDLDRSVREALLRMRDTMIHENVTRFFGLSWSNSNRLFMIRENCERGTLKTILWSESYQTNEAMKMAVSKEIANGMAFLHSHRIVHGTLTLTSCLVDSRWSVKVTDWEYAYLYEALRKTKGNRKNFKVPSSILYHKSEYCREGYEKEGRPEGMQTLDLNTHGFSFQPTKAGDVHSFGIIMYEIFTLTQARYGCLADATEEAENGIEEMRANIRQNEAINGKARQIIDSALQKKSIMRPSFQQIVLTLSAATPHGKSSFLDIMMEELEAYAAKVNNQLQKVTCGLAESESRCSQLTERLIPWKLLGISDFRLIEEPVVTVQQSVAVVGFRIRSFPKQDSSIESALEAITQFSWQLHDVAQRLVDSQEQLYLVEETSESLVIVTPETAFPDSLRPIAAAVGCLVSFVRCLHDQASEISAAFPSAAGLSLTAAIDCGPVSCILARSGSKGLPRCFFFGEAVETVRQLASDETSSGRKIVLSEKANLLVDGFTAKP